jgi:cadmium resistance protein CadD (predicted permease)
MMLSLLTLTVATFIGTTLDNLLMLVVLRVSGTPARHVSGGFVSGSACLLALCAAGSALPSVIPVEYIGLLGLVPVALGLVGLVAAVRAAPQAQSGTTRSGVLGIATTQLASSFDTLAAFLPLFADTLRSQRLVIAGGFATMTIAWLLLSSVLARTPGIAPALRPFERFARPLVLVLVGLYVLANTATDVQPDRVVPPVATGRVDRKAAPDASPVAARVERELRAQGEFGRALRAHSAGATAAPVRDRGVFIYVAEANSADPGT